MKIINKEMIKKLYGLCQIYYDDNDIEGFEEWAKGIIFELDKLREIDTEGIEPIYYCNEEPRAFIRDGKNIEHISQNDVLKNAPQKEGYFITIAKVIK
ncbi:Asp-tRNA(Asn)/Glu-tRNA(Gln) amidotransferase subunit GatC [Spiroplasma endosymbiont of Aspidapion aeneum]|uniref:Asp-tRNA(Asn)/Glu-tRNA(Gln) amidotransferase subunit GatC n=1 Tax=Spiroplasma endosymbiont of Aspidapion aeneum TaxID=3066276 RepID=UPI00313F0CDD